MSTERLLEINKIVKTAKTKGSEIKGEITSVKKQMKNKFNVITLSSAKTELTKKNKNLDRLEKTFAIKIEKLENAYQWDN